MNNQTQQNPYSRTLVAGISGATIGGISGVLIGLSVEGNSFIIIGGVAFAVYMGLAEAVTDFTRKPASLKPLAHRIIGSTIMGAAFGSVLGEFSSAWLVALLIGGVAGLLALGPKKLALGIIVGITIAVVTLAFESIPNTAVVGGSVILLFRLLLILLIKDDRPIQFAAEKVAPSQARYIVPFEAHTQYIGTEFMKTLARESDGTFKRNKSGIGIVETLDALRGPNFDPEKVDLRIREFYEHTTWFKLTIEPIWNPFMKPFFWIFKTFVARKIGQANLPFNSEETQQGVVSYIDSIDYNRDDGNHIHTLRGWIRAFEASGEAIYVGIYTVLRHEDVGYVSVGFPLPEANFTATLLPYNLGDGNLLLTTRSTGMTFPGHYLADIDNEDGSLTVVKLPTFGEELEVYIKNGQMQADHSFYLGGYRFLTLLYTINRKPK